MTDENATSEPTVDQERGLFGSAGWDATDEGPRRGSRQHLREDTRDPRRHPRPDPDKDQG